ncbi:MAG: hypothetical protein WDM70_10315 [Nitrosomonadales bacterium]
MNQILASIAKALLVTLVSTAATIAVDKIRRYNAQRNNDEDGYYNQPYYDEYDHW